MRLNASAQAQEHAALVRGNIVGGPVGGYAPQDIQAAYGLAGTAATNGVGQTIGVIDAYSDPRAAADLAIYRTHFGLPACAIGTAATSCLRIVNQAGGQTPPPADAGWAQEITLDLDAVSTSCPLCHILLVEAASSADTDLIAAIREASSLGASVLSLSFGGCEHGAGSGDFDSALLAANVPVTVATGDGGYQSADNNPNSCPVNTPEYPASSPDVTAVGGTSLSVASNARGWSETAWSYSTNGAGGSGCSGFEPKPSWQKDTGCALRTVSDVSADADPGTGLSVYNAYSDSGWSVYGGTSLAAPLVAGMYALANSPSAAIGGGIWYHTVPVNDITSGTTAPSAADCSPSYLCNAATGYDGPTGMGTPDGPPIVQATLAALAPSQSTTAFPVSWSLPAGSRATSYRLWVKDTTHGAGPWLPYIATTATSTTFYGFQNHSYGFALQYFVANGWTSGGPSQPTTSTTISPTATLAEPFTGMYAVDGHGTLHAASSPPLSGPSWGWDIGRGVVSSPSGQGGVVLDGWGGLSAFGDSAVAHGTGYWSGWDIADGIATLPGRTTGYVLDRWGGLHAFTVGAAARPGAVTGNAYWSGWNIARSVATFSDGKGGLVLDGWGGVHAFAVSPNAQPAAARTTGYWANWDIARNLVLLAGSTRTSYRGYVLDGYGGLHAFASVGTALPPTVATPYYTSGSDSARSVVMVPGSSSQGYVVDALGGFHPFGSAPPVLTGNYGAGGALGRGATAA
jgi:Subtilase family